MSNGINGPEQDALLVLVDEEGEEHRYSLERIVELDNKKYVVMIPEIQEGDEEEAHVFRLETEQDGEEVLVDVEDEELDRIQAYLDQEAEGE
jgi:putative Holliday junction resolvase